MSQTVLSLVRALEFAARRHTDQRRKGVRAEPYINHLAEVAALLAEATDGTDSELVVAGLLHDAIEDTDATREDIEQAFGPDVAGLVVEVTDDKRLHKHERKRQQVETAPHKSARGKMIKIADKTSNLRAMIDSPPADWSLRRRLEYFEWADAVVAGCRGVNPRLEVWFDEAHAAGIAALRGTDPAQTITAGPEPDECRCAHPPE